MTRTITSYSNNEFKDYICMFPQGTSEENVTQQNFGKFGLEYRYRGLLLADTYGNINHSLRNRDGSYDVSQDTVVNYINNNNCNKELLREEWGIANA